MLLGAHAIWGSATATSHSFALVTQPRPIDAARSCGGCRKSSALELLVLRISYVQVSRSLSVGNPLH
jgi:hypothetical protein